MTLRYTDDRKELVKMARAKRMTDVEILKALVANEFGDGNRLKIVFSSPPT